MITDNSQNSQTLAKADGYQNIDVNTNSDEATSLSETAQTQANSEDRSGVFSELLDQLSDHNSFNYGAYNVGDLPKIFIDDGFHFFWNTEDAVASGKYLVEEHHGHKTILNASTGQVPNVDLSVSNLVIFQWLAVFLCFLIFKKASGAYKKNPGKAPKGFQSAIEVLVLFVRNDIVRMNIPSRKAADYLVPYFISLFFFILMMNLLGLVPGMHTPTGAIVVTGTLAITSFIVTNLTSIKVAGVGAWFKHLLGGAPAWLAPIMIPIEVIALFVKPFALTIRLFANITGGHVILYSLLGILFLFNTIALFPAITGFSLFIYALELLVAFIQAYLFTILTAIYVGLAIGDHGDDEHSAHAAAH